MSLLQLNAVLRKESLLAIIFDNFCTRKRKGLAIAHWAKTLKKSEIWRLKMKVLEIYF